MIDGRPMVPLQAHYQKIRTITHHCLVIIAIYYNTRYTLRVNQILLDKLAYSAEFEGRTKNKELEQLFKKRIASFEKEHGQIVVDDKEE